MNSFNKLFIFSLLLFFSSCSKDFGPTGLSDAEIIQLIKESALTDVSITDLPSRSQDVVIQDYFEYDDVASRKASGLGYEVALAGRGHRIGSRHEIYFNVEGRKLDPNDWGDKRGWDKDGYDREFDGEKDWRCFNLVFPITFNMPDGSSVIVESDEEGNWDVIKSWYEANPDSEEKPEMEFPIVINYENDTYTLNSSDELQGAYSRCEPRRKRDEHKRKRHCFSLVYPVSYALPDGSVMDVASDDEEGWAAVKSWYSDNSEFEGVMPELAYPVDIVYELEDGEMITTINSEEEMYAAKAECYDDWGPEECFSLVYPVSYTLPDGSVMDVASDDEEGWAAVKSWYGDNTEFEGVMPELAYPVDILYETEEGETVITINSDEEMGVAKRDCHENWDEDEGDDEERRCFDVVLPVTFLMPDGSSLVVAEESDWRSIDEWYVENSDVEEEPDYQFPIEVVYDSEEGSNTVVINNQEELQAAEQDCLEDEE